MEDLDRKLYDTFPGKVVRKDLTKKIKEGANVPVYVLEYLLGMYCATDDEEGIEDGVHQVKKILAENYVRPDEAEKVKSQIRESGHFTVIDRITARLDARNDLYKAEFSNLGLFDVVISAKYFKDYDKLLTGGIWCIVQMAYFFDENDKTSSPFTIEKLTPIQMPSMDMDELFDQRERFSKDEWIDILIRSIGMEPTQFEQAVKWHLLERLVPLVENNYNLCELGPRGTGKSHVYKEISPNSILVSGGQTTVANLFYNMASHQIGLVGTWDTVAFDEVAGIKFKDQDGIQIMKDYMASGSFARGREEKTAAASMVFIGNINQSVDVLLKTSNLFGPFPDGMAGDSAFFDRMHFYLPGWEIPKMHPEFFTNNYGFITDYLACFMREMRKRSFSDAIDHDFHLGNNLNQRDVIAVRKTVSGLIKLVYPGGQFDKAEVEEILHYALVGRRRVKEQLKKIGGLEFYDVNFSYIDNDSMEEQFVSVPEQGGGKIIPEGMGKPGHVYTVGRGKTGMIGTYNIETEMTSGNGKFERAGFGSDSAAKESVDTAFHYFKSNGKSISGKISTKKKDYLLQIQDIYGVGLNDQLSLAALIALCSVAVGRPVQSQLVILGSISISGTVQKVDDLASILQVCLDSGGKKVLLPMLAAADLGTVPPEVFAKFQIIFYQSAGDAVFKALGVS